MKNPTRTDTEASGRVRWAHAKTHELERDSRASLTHPGKGCFLWFGRLPDPQKMSQKIGSVRRKIRREARSGAATLVPTHSPSPRTPLRCVGPLTPPRSVPVCPWWSSSGTPPRNAEIRLKSGGNAQGIPLPREKRSGFL